MLEILACPEDKGPLLYFADEDSLYNPRLKRRYSIRDDIPIMLIDEAETVDETEHARALDQVGMKHVELCADAGTVRFLKPGLEINLGSIGKGYALDRVADLLRSTWNLPAANAKRYVGIGLVSAKRTIRRPPAAARWTSAPVPKVR